jgi:hypothetical protein
MLRPRLCESNACSSNGTHWCELPGSGFVQPHLADGLPKRVPITAMTDRLEPAQTAVHTGICRLATVVVMSSGYIGWHYRAAPNAAAAVLGGELVRVAFTERRDVKAGALIRALTGTKRRFRRRW